MAMNAVPGRNTFMYDLVIPLLPPDDRQRAARVTGERCRSVLVVIENRMNQLRSMTRSIPSGSVVLDIQRRGDRGSVTLRWRAMHGGLVSDAALPSIIDGYPSALREWYAAVHVQALWLNVAERSCRRLAGDFDGLAEALSECRDAGRLSV
jgi:hypothetical protein